MRTDIYVNTITGDIVLKNQNSLEEYLFEWIEETAVSYTHLDVYKRQLYYKQCLN